MAIMSGNPGRRHDGTTGSPGTAAGTRVPGACQVILARARELTGSHVIRLGSGQGEWIPSGREVICAGKPPRRSARVRHAWREVLDVYRNRSELEAHEGEQGLPCTQESCFSRLYSDGWHPRAGQEEDHQHQAARRPGSLTGATARLADAAWENSEGSVVIRLLLHEISDPTEIETILVILNGIDLVETQSLPAPGTPGWGGDPAPEAAGRKTGGAKKGRSRAGRVLLRARPR